MNRFSSRNTWNTDYLYSSMSGPRLQRHQFKNVRKEELRIVVIGKTGTGKSSTGNSIIGEKTFEYKFSANSVTNKCKLAINTRFGRQIVLVDTPGLFDTKISNERITKEIVKCIGMTAPGPHAFLLTVNIGRFTKEEQDTVKHFVNHFGDGIYNFMTVVFTKADDLEDGNMTIESYVKEGPEQLKEILQRCDNRYVPFNNKLTGARQEHQVKQLISRIDDAVNKNGGSCFTNEMYQEAEKTLRRQEEEMKRKLQEEETRQIEKLQKDYENRIAETKNLKYKKKRNLEEARDKDMRDQISSLNNRVQHLEMIQKLEQQRVTQIEAETGRDLQKIRDDYAQRLNPSNLRDDYRRGCEKETDIITVIFTFLERLFLAVKLI